MGSFFPSDDSALLTRENLLPIPDNQRMFHTGSVICQLHPYYHYTRSAECNTSYRHQIFHLHRCSLQSADSDISAQDVPENHIVPIHNHVTLFPDLLLQKNKHPSSFDSCPILHIRYFPDPTLCKSDHKFHLQLLFLKNPIQAGFCFWPDFYPEPSMPSLGVSDKDHCLLKPFPARSRYQTSHPDH